jgi:hypothetical protein
MELVPKDVKIKIKDAREKIFGVKGEKDESG